MELTYERGTYERTVYVCGLFPGENTHCAHYGEEYKIKYERFMAQKRHM